jgi:hypothetical protein
MEMIPSSAETLAVLINGEARRHRSGARRETLNRFCVDCELQRAAIISAMRTILRPHCERLIALLFAACLAGSGLAQTPAPTTGIEGVISIGPIHGGPVRAGEANSAPLAKATFDVSSSSGVVASFETDDTGHFRVALAPGRYSIQRHGPRKKLGGCGPFEVEVPADAIRKIRWDCDTGMR